VLQTLRISVTAALFAALSLFSLPAQAFLGTINMSDPFSPPAPTSFEDLNREQLATGIYTSFRNSGFSDAQAKALTAEVNRENNLRPKYMFGTHVDDANKAVNIGMLSFQGDRSAAVTDFLRQRGLVDEKGKITPGFDAIQAQTDFIYDEMLNSPSYKRTREEFLSNPDVDPNTAAKVLGLDYIRYSQDPKYLENNYKRLNQGYELLTGELGEVSPRGVLGSTRPKPRPADLQASNKSPLDAMGALSYLELAGLTGGAPKAVDLGARITPGRAGSGGRALKRLGIASLV
jgi:hypothetical protein